MKLGLLGPTAPPVDSIAKQTRRNETKGFDSVWFPDHLMGWYPESIWTPDVSPIAELRDSPHSFFEATNSMTLAADATSEVRVGSCVTEVLRRHPAMLAQSLVTVDHVSEGRAVLGIGAGEAENAEPYGIQYRRPVSRLEEALEILELLWNSEPRATIDYEGEFWTLENAIFDLPLYDGDPPPIWIGAHGPRMLSITSRFADGWLPADLTLDGYRDRWTDLSTNLEERGRNPASFTAALFSNLIVGESEAECLEMMDTPMVKARALGLPPERYEAVGASHPLGDEGGITHYTPSKLSREEALSAVESVPVEVIEPSTFYGTAEDIIDQIEAYEAAGLDHLIFWNETPFGDPGKVEYSYQELDKVVEYFDDRA